jgi:3-dehydroquinate dehydratase-1
MKQAFAENPVICTPLIGRQLVDIVEEGRNIILKKPDIIEWRADFFDHIRDISKLVEALSALRAAIGDMPILFTVRSAAEGGDKNLHLTSEEKIQIYKAVCQSKAVQYVDFEFDNSPEDIKQVRDITLENGVKLVFSYHDLEKTPDEQFVIEKCLLAEEYGGDVVKLSVRANSLEDVLDLMKTSLSVQRHTDIPLIIISGGKLGTISRLFGWMFGSQLTFAIGDKSLGSGSGQMPVEDVKTVIDILKNYQ